MGVKSHVILKSGNIYLKNMLRSKIFTNHFKKNTLIFGVRLNNEVRNEFDYIIGDLSTNCIRPFNELILFSIPTAQYAKFTLNKNIKSQQALKYIYDIWLPQNYPGYQPAFNFEMLHPKFTDIYIPICLTKHMI